MDVPDISLSLACLSCLRGGSCLAKLVVWAFVIKNPADIGQEKWDELGSFELRKEFSRERW